MLKKIFASTPYTLFLFFSLLYMKKKSKVMQRSRNDQVEIFFEEAKIGDEKCFLPKLQNRIYQKKKEFGIEDNFCYSYNDEIQLK